MLKDNPYLQDWLDQRSMPAFFIVNKRGKLVFINSSAQQLCQLHEFREVLKPVRQQLTEFNNNRQRNPNLQVISAGSFFDSVFSSRHRTYGIRAFWLESVSQTADCLVGVLAQCITANRLNLRKIKERFYLTDREIEVIKGLELGMTDKKIAALLEVSPNTVRGYLKTVRAKMGVSNRTGILRLVRAV